MYWNVYRKLCLALLIGLFSNLPLASAQTPAASTEALNDLSFLENSTLLAFHDTSAASMRTPHLNQTVRSPIISKKSARHYSQPSRRVRSSVSAENPFPVNSSNYVASAYQPLSSAQGLEGEIHYTDQLIQAQEQGKAFPQRISAQNMPAQSFSSVDQEIMLYPAASAHSQAPPQSAFQPNTRTAQPAHFNMSQDKVIWEPQPSAAPPMITTAPAWPAVSNDKIISQAPVPVHTASHITHAPFVSFQPMPAKEISSLSPADMPMSAAPTMPLQKADFISIVQAERMQNVPVEPKTILDAQPIPVPPQVIQPAQPVQSAQPVQLTQPAQRVQPVEYASVPQPSAIPAERMNLLPAKHVSSPAKLKKPVTAAPYIASASQQNAFIPVEPQPSQNFIPIPPAAPAPTLAQAPLVQTQVIPQSQFQLVIPQVAYQSSPIQAGPPLVSAASVYSAYPTYPTYPSQTMPIQHQPIQYAQQQYPQYANPWSQPALDSRVRVASASLIERTRPEDAVPVVGGQNWRSPFYYQNKLEQSYQGAFAQVETNMLRGRLTAEEYLGLYDQLNEEYAKNLAIEIR